MGRYDLDEHMEMPVVDRMWWGEIEPRKDEMTKATHPFLWVRLSYDDLRRGDEPNLLDAMMRWETHLMEEKKYPDIPYNFLIGNHGIVYEGRGWDYDPMNTTTGNTIEICYIGDFTVEDPDWLRIYTAHNLVLFGVKENFITNHFRIIPYKTRKTEVLSE